MSRLCKDFLIFDFEHFDYVYLHDASCQLLTTKYHDVILTHLKVCYVMSCHVPLMIIIHYANVCIKYIIKNIFIITTLPYTTVCYLRQGMAWRAI